MVTEWQTLLAGMTLSAGASASELARLHNPPAELVELLRFANGAKSPELQLWSVDEILGVTAQYEDYEPVRGLHFIGTDCSRESHIASSSTGAGADARVAGLSGLASSIALRLHGR